MWICIREKLDDEKCESWLVPCDEDRTPIEGVISCTVEESVDCISTITLKCYLGKTDVQKMAERLQT